MRNIIPALEFLSAVFMILLFVGMHIYGRRKDKTSRFFIINIAFVMFYLIADALSYILEGSNVSDGLIAVFEYLSYSGGNVIFAAFTFYVWSILDKERPSSLWPAFGVTGICLIENIIMLVGIINGEMLSVMDGQLILGPLASYFGYATIVVMAAFCVYILTKKKYVGNVVVLSTMSYLVLPTAAAILGIINPSFDFTYIVIALVLTTIYIVLQAGELQQKELKELRLSKTLFTDRLTGLRNRRAYEDAIKGTDKNQSTVVLFCDLNGLKATNDTYGHEAGDQLLTTFAKILTYYYPRENCYRISGDEFVVIIPEEFDVFEKKFEKFKNTVMDNSWIASVGKSKGRGTDLLELISQAERNMYSDKNEFYARNNINRRRV